MDFSKLTTSEKIEIYNKIKDFLDYLKKQEKELEQG